MKSDNLCASVIQTSPGYKLAEADIVPEAWEWMRLGDVCEITTGKRDVNEGNPHGAYPFFTCSRRHTFSDSYSFDTEAILVAGNGDVGTLHYYKGKFEVYQRTYVLSRFLIDIQYVLHYLGANLVPSLSVGKIGTSIPYIKLSNLTDFRLLMPRVPEERRAIAEVLSDVDDLISALDKLIAKKRAIRQGAMQQLLTGKTRLPGFGGKWPVRTFDEVFTRLRAQKRQIQTYEYKDHGKYPVIDQGKILIVAYSDASENVVQCPSDGVIVFGDHTREVKFVDFDFVVGADGTQLLTTMRGYSPKFFF